MTDILSNVFPSSTEATRTIADSAKLGGRLRGTSALVTVNAAQIADRLMLAKVPSSARLSNLSVVNFDDLGTAVTLDIGFANDPNGLVAAENVATAAGSVNMMKAVALANYGKRMWQLAGLTKDPGGELDIFGTIAGAATTASNLSVHAEIVYSTD